MNLPEIAAAPDWLIDLVKSKHSAASDGVPVIELDSETSLKRAAHYLQHDAPNATAGERNATAYKVSAKIKDFGVSEHENLALLMEHWNGERCTPPLDYEELRRTVESAYKTGFLPPGAASPEHDFADVPAVAEAQDQSSKPKRRLKAERFADIKFEPNRKYLIKGWFDQESTSVIFGKPNAGKSFVALDWALHVATGRPWREHRVDRMGVLYVAAEGSHGFPARVEAWRRHHEISEAPFALIRHPVDLRRKEGHTDELIEIVREEEESAMGVKIGWVIIDTLARALAGGDESSSVDMGIAINNMDRIRYATAAAVSFIHHSGKDESRGARGHSSLLGAIDTEIEVRPDRIVNDKQRDMAKQGPVGFRLESVLLGEDQDGDQITSRVVLPASLTVDTDFSDGGKGRPGEAVQAAVRLLVELTDTARQCEGLSPFDENPWIPIEQLEKICMGNISSGNEESQRRAFKRVLDKMADKNAVEINEQNLRLK